MSVSLQERRERVERRLEALLLGLDETVRQVYESLLERGADYDELTPEKAVARLEGFHDYIITREETGVAHPTFSDYLEAKRKFGDEMLSFGTGKHSTHQPEVEVAEPEVVEPEVVEPEVEVEEEAAPVVEDEETSLVASDEDVEDTDEDKVTSFLADFSELNVAGTDSNDEVEIVDDEAVIDDNNDVEGEEVAPAGEEEVIDDNNDVDAEEVKPSVWEDDEEEVVILADEDAAPVAAPVEAKGFIAPAPVEGQGFIAPAPVVEEKKEEKKEESVDPVTKPVAGRINERVIIDQDFGTKLGGYNIDEVDDYLDKLAEFFKVSHSADEYTAQVKEIEEKIFSKKNFKKGFAINEVDDFLDTVILELQNRAVESK